MPKIIVEQAVLQSENRVFDSVIIALEYLEEALGNTKGYENNLGITAKGKPRRDFHKEDRDLIEWFKELRHQILCLKLATTYEDKKTIESAIQLFLLNLLEWYAGRQNLKFFDEIDAAVYPIILSLCNKEMQEIMSSFEKYVYKEADSNNKTLNEKYESARDGVEAWIIAQDIFGNIKKTVISDDDTSIEGIYTHNRGQAVDGYIRIIKALTTLFYVSRPVDDVYDVIATHLPEVTASVPHFNKEFFKQFFENKLKEPVTGSSKIDSEITVDKFEKNGVTYVRLYCMKPVNIPNGVEKVPFTFWKHEDEDCNGEIYLGDNGMLYCKKCSKCKKITESAFNEAGKISFNIKRDELEPKIVAEVISVSGQMIQFAGISWLRNLIMSISDRDSIEINKEKYDKESILPELQKAVREILDKENIEYSNIIIEII